MAVSLDIGAYDLAGQRYNCGRIVMRSDYVEVVYMAYEGFVALSQDGTFSVIQGEVDGRPLVAMIDMGLRELPDKQGLSFFLSLSTSLINPTSEGLPTRSDTDSLNTWEHVVEERLRSAGKFVFVGRVTWNGHRELLYYVGNQQPTVETLLDLNADAKTRNPSRSTFLFSSWEP